MAEALKRELDALKLATDTVKAQGLIIEKLAHRLARLLRVQFGRNSEQTDIAELHLMFEEVDTPAPVADDVAAATKKGVR